MYTVYIRFFGQGNHQTSGQIRCIYTILANPTNNKMMQQCLPTSVARHTHLTTSTHTHIATHSCIRTHIRRRACHGRAQLAAHARRDNLPGGGVRLNLNTPRLDDVAWDPHTPFHTAVVGSGSQNVQVINVEEVGSESICDFVCTHLSLLLQASMMSKGTGRIAWDISWALCPLP